MFITLEGIEGSGKSTQIENIVAFLKARGYECVTSREPGGTEIGAQIRGVLLDPRNSDMDPTVELLLYTADRVQHIRNVIQPHLAAGRVVICDRYFDATMVYQGYARGLDKEMIRSLHQLACGGLQPDLTLLFDLEPHLGLERAWRQINRGGRTQKETRFEQEKLDFHQAVRDGYLDMARLAPDRFRIIAADQSPQAVAHSIEGELATVLPQKK